MNTEPDESVGAEDAAAIGAKRREQIDQLVERVGEEWLQRAKGGDHPVANWWHEFESKGGREDLLTTDTASARLAFAAKRLNEAWDLLAELRGGEDALMRDVKASDRVWGVMGEAFAIVELRGGDVTLRAIKVSDRRTPDLVVSRDDGEEAEVEVKVRHFSGIDREVARFWKDLYDRLRPVVENSGWVCEIDFDGRVPSLRQGDAIAAELGRRLDAEGTEFVIENLQGFSVRARRIVGLRTQPKDLQIRVESIGEFAVYQAQVRTRPSFEGRLCHAVSCRRRRRGGHLAGLKRSMRNAGRQFTGDRPGLVIVLLSDEVASAVLGAGPAPDEALFNFANAFGHYLKDGHFKRAPNITEVRLFAQGFPTVDDVIEEHTACFGIVNPIARHHLPGKFGLRGSPDYSWDSGDK